MIQAFYTGVTGLKSGQTAIDVTANNISNVSTLGFRANRAEFSNLFEDAVSSASSPNSSTIGAGTKIQANSMVLENGAYSLSDRSTDVAIEGSGWFGVQGKYGPEFTRAGNFTFDADSGLVTPDGNYVLGTMADNINYENSTLTNTLNEVSLGNVEQSEILRFPQDLTHPGEASTYAKFYGNLDMNQEDGIAKIGASVIDSNGDKNALNLSFKKSQNQPQEGSSWEVSAALSSLNGETLYDTKTGTVMFDGNGGLISSTLTTMDNNGSELEIDLGSDFNGITLSADSPVTASSESDGTLKGDLAGYDINRNAEVVAMFSNGVQSSVGQIGVYHFQNDQGLERSGNSNFRPTSNSGDPFFMQDENGENTVGAKVMTYRLENSNVAMEESLTQLIVLQRSYDANAKSVTTADQMMQKALNMDA